jgi:histidinol dehydrogenase
MAYGTESVPKCDIIAGPGGPYVSAAQRLVSKDVKVPLFPGPSEGMVIADEFANPKFVAADVLSEAEHGKDSAGVLVTDSEEFAVSVAKEMEAMMFNLPQPRREYAEESMKKYSGIVVAQGMKKAIDFVNDYAPEHLGIQTEDPEETLKQLKNAGTFCLGPYSPITAGNFIAGPNARLPTGRAAKRPAGISVDSFVKKPTVENFTKEGLALVKDSIITMSDFEGFSAHMNSVKVRFEEDK